MNGVLASSNRRRSSFGVHNLSSFNSDEDDDLDDVNEFDDMDEGININNEIIS